jgi:hypothetical protein
MLADMLRLTRQERTVLCVVLFLFLTGWIVKAWRADSLPSDTVDTTAPSPNAHRSF